MNERTFPGNACACGPQMRRSQVCQPSVRLLLARSRRFLPRPYRARGLSLSITLAYQRTCLQQRAFLPSRFSHSFSFPRGSQAGAIPLLEFLCFCKRKALLSEYLRSVIRCASVLPCRLPGHGSSFLGLPWRKGVCS